VEDFGTQASENIKAVGARQQVDFVIRPNLIPKNAAPSAKLLTLVAVVAVIAGLYFGRQVLIPLALAVVLAFLLTPVVGCLEKCRLGRVPSVLAVLVLVFALVGIGGWLVTGQLMNIIDQFPDYQSNIHEKMQSLRAHHGNRLTNATKTVADLSKELTAASESAADKNTAKRSGAAPIPVKVAQPPTNAPQYLRTVVGPLTGVFETTAIVVVFTMFMLVKREDLRNRLIRLAGQGQLTVVTQALDDASRRLSRYLFLQFLVNAAYGAMFAGGIYLIGIPHALLWGVLACLLRFIPYVGTAIAAGIPTLMAFAIFPGWRQAILVVALFVILELVISNVIEPWLYGAHTGISSLAILVAAVFWAVLWGPIGLILSTPLTVGLILMGRYVPQLSFLEVLLGDEPVLPLEAHFYQRLLALDPDEAALIVENYLKEKSIGSFYDSILIPALAMAEQDRHLNTLDATTADFISQSTRDLIEELGERPLEPQSPDLTKNGEKKNGETNNGGTGIALLNLTEDVLKKDGLEKDGPGKDAPANGSADDDNDEDEAQPELFSLADAERTNRTGHDYSKLAGLQIVCIPAGDEADEIVGAMLVQLLKRLGADVRIIPVPMRANFVNDVTSQSGEVAIVSALPPFAAGHAKSLCKRLRRWRPDMKIVLGLWSFEGGIAKAQERIGPGCADMVATSLEQAISQLAETVRSIPRVEQTRAQSSSRA
jgi:predicted PurR-regulated permease PerM